jgi:TPR repeat protein
MRIISCISLPPATRLSVPIYDFAEANEELANKHTEIYYSCCGKTICMGCEYSFWESGNSDKCPFCNADRCKTDEEHVEDIRRRVEVNDANSVYVLGNYYYHGKFGLLQDHARAIELYARAADLGYSLAHNSLGFIYHHGGDMKKAKFHYEAAAMAGHEMARFNFGVMEYHSGNKERAIKHWTIAASAGDYEAMHNLRALFDKGAGSRESIDSTLAAYNNSCTEMRSKARDAAIRWKLSV